MELNELFKKSEKELNALKKADIIKCIKDKAWHYRNVKENNESLRKDIQIAKAPYDQAKQMLIGATGYEVELDDYSKKPKLETVDLCFLIGLLLAKGA